MPGDSPDAPPPRGGRSGWRAALTDPAVLTVALYAAVAAVAAVAAFLTIFTVFAPYDDEGTLLVTLKAFVNGDVLYRDVYSPYGPFYYELFGGLFALTGKAVTTDASRSIVIVIWVGTSLLYGLAAQRLSGLLAVGLGGMIVAFGALRVLAGEPMHPQVLCVLLLGAFTLLAVLGPTRRTLLAGGAAGALLAALALTKLNLGAFAVAGVALAAVLVCGPLYERRWLRWPVILAFLAMPLALTSRDLEISWVRELMLLELLAAAAVIAAAWRPVPTATTDPSRELSRWLLAAIVGFVLAFVAIVVAIVLTGPSLADVYDGVVVQAARVRDVLLGQFTFPPAALGWGIAALGAAVLTTRLRGLDGERLSPWPGLLRVAAGLVIWFAIAGIAPLRVGPSAENPDTLPLLLAWVAAIAPAGGDEPPFRRFVRVLLPALAVAQTLQVYPVSGSQMGIAALTFVPVGAICIGDGVASLRAWSAARGGIAPQRLAETVIVVGVALVALLMLDTMLRGIATNGLAYRERAGLPFSGATALRLPAEEAAVYTELVDLLHENECTTFIGYPNINSLYLWSGIEAPPPKAPGAWIKALESDKQQQAVDALRASPRPCAIRSQARADLWLHGEAPPDRPLVRYIEDEFEPVAEVGEFEFLLPKPPGSASRADLEVR